jgi:trigger factor
VKTQVENVTDVKKIIHFEIPWEDIDKHIRQTVRQISKQARVPGFRPGKAPEKVIRSRFAHHIKEEVISHVVPEAYKEAIEENKFEPISEPDVHDVMYSEGSPFLFKVTIETRPQIQVSDYKGLELTSEKIEVTDEEVETVLKGYQDRAAELIPLADTPAENGHFINAKVKAWTEKEGKRENLYDDRTMIAIGAEDNHAAFNENLTGKKASEVVEFEASYPADYPEKSIAGKQIHYRVEIENVNEKRIAPLDDEFAKDLGDFSSLQDLKDKIKKDIIQFKTGQQRSKLREEILKMITDRNPFEVPESLVAKETESLLQSYAYSLHQRGIDLENKEIDWKELQTRFARQADQNVRGTLLIQAVASAENITVNDEDVEKSIAQIADQERRAPEAVKAELVKKEKMESLKHRILLSKTLDFLFEQAKVTYL